MFPPFLKRKVIVRESNSAAIKNLNFAENVFIKNF